MMKISDLQYKQVPSQIENYSNDCVTETVKMRECVD